MEIKMKKSKFKIDFSTYLENHTHYDVSTLLKKMESTLSESTLYLYNNSEKIKVISYIVIAEGTPNPQYFITIEKDIEIMDVYVLPNIINYQIVSFEILKK